MIYNNMFYPFIEPLPDNLDEPPTVYAIMQSIVNFNKKDKTKIKDLAKSARTTIFNFDYPLSNHFNKEDFECMILNNFITRRIGFETVTLFRIKLEVKLNEIMPYYNKLMDSFYGWNLFNDGEIITKINNTTKDTTIESENNTTTESTSETVNNGTVTKDNRYSNLPQNQISDIADGNYMTEYTKEVNTANDTTSTTGTGSTNSDSSSTGNEEVNTNETITRTEKDKIKIYSEFLKLKENIYTNIFNDLECLFLGYM